MRFVECRLAFVACLPLLVLLGWSAASSAAPFAYISSLSTNTVFVLDTATNTVTATVPVGLSPRGVAVHPTGSTVYVANDRSSTISVVSTVTNSVVATVIVGAGPEGVAVHPRGTSVYVTNRHGDNVSVVDTETNRVIATVPVGSRPRGVAVNSEGSRIYVANSGSYSISVIDAFTNTVIATIPIGLPMHPPRVPHGIAVHPAGTHVYVATAGNFATGALLVIDAVTHAVSATVGLGAPAHGVTVHPTGSFVYVTTVAEVKSPGPAVVPPALSVVSTATHTVTAFVSLGASSWSSPNGVAVHPDGAVVYVTNEENYSLYLVCALTNTVIRTVALPSPSAGYGQFIGPDVGGPSPRSGSTPKSRPSPPPRARPC